VRSRLRYEHEARDILIREGWACTRSAGSRGPVDLIAMNEKAIRLVQVKALSHPDSSRSIGVLVQAAEDLRRVPVPTSTTSRWLFLRAVPGSWLRVCVDGLPNDDDVMRAALDKRVRSHRREASAA
jgi:hypothetical protein